MSVLVTKDLTLKLEDKTIFENINLLVDAGTVHALIGINGSGKSSIANVLMGITKSTSGQILFEGHDITDLGISERARLGITLAWQEPARFEGIKVKDYLLLSSKIKNIDKIKEALFAVGLKPSKYLNRIVDKTLSGGERKRIELASILLMRPKLSILDEIDSGIDFVGIDKVLDSIRQLATSDRSVLLITHQESFLKIADKATLICNGVILKTGTPQEISKYYRYECSSCEDEDYRKHLENLLLETVRSNN